MTQAYQLAVEGANGSNNSSSLNAIASQITNIQSSLVNIGNTQNSSGQYVFAGQNTSTAPFSATNGKLTYTGDQGNINVEVAPGDQMTVNTPGSPLFTSMYSQLQSLKEDLQSGNLSKISNTDIANLKASMTTASNLNGQFGAQVDTVTTLTNNNTQRLTDLTSGISNIENVNVAAAAITLSQAQTAYQAALEVTANANKYNLVDFLSST
jgi:flagellar hook-associated protein 3 FlgL